MERSLKQSILTAANPLYTATMPPETGSRWTTNPAKAIQPTMSLGESKVIPMGTADLLLTMYLTV